MNILVTGGAGYLGSTLIEFLLAAGHTVEVVDNFMYRQSSLNHLCANKRMNISRADVRVKSEMKPLLEKADLIIPLAALVGSPLCDRDPVTALSTNRDAVLEMFKSLSKDQMVIMPTTNSAYGHGLDGNFCDESSPLNPISTYAKHKVEVEKALLSRENVISFRLATVFGMSPRMRLDLLVNDFTYRALNDRSLVLFESHFKRNYIHVRDVSRVFLHGIEHFAKLKNDVFNVGLSDANLSKLELSEKIRQHLPSLEILEAGVGKDPDQRNYIVSNEKIESTGFKPIYSLDDGISELIRGYRMLNNSRYTNL